MKLISLETFKTVKNQHDLTHWHEKIEVLRVIDHAMVCVVNGKEYALQAGDLCIINRHQLHRIYCEPGNNCTFQRMQVDTSLFTADKVIYQKYVVPMMSDEAFTHIQGKHGSKFASEVENIMDGIGDLERMMPVAYEMQVIALVFMLFRKFYQYYEASRGNAQAMANPDILLYRRIADYIARNYADKLTLDEIAASGNISRSKCCALFREYAGHTPIDFLNLYRLKASSDLLKNTADSISFIAHACGFGQQSYYNRLFLREYGMTPKEYREAST